MGLYRESAPADYRPRFIRCRASSEGWSSSPSRNDGTETDRMLSGLLRCGACGSGMPIKDHDHNRLHQNEGKRRRAYYLNEIESVVVESLHQHLGTKQATDEYVRRYN
jgi:hypothetical protein